jgi:hypothetical protein
LGIIFEPFKICSRDIILGWSAMDGKGMKTTDTRLRPMLHLHLAVRGTVPQKQRCDTADLNANWYEKYAAFLFALVIPLLLAGCKSKPIEALPSVAETRNASNPFIGLWEVSLGRSYIYNYMYKMYSRRIYKFTNTRQWESYYVRDGVIEPIYDLRSRGTYTYRGSVLYMTYVNYLGDVYGSTWVTNMGRLDGDALKFSKDFILHRVSADSVPAD